VALEAGLDAVEKSGFLSLLGNRIPVVQPAARGYTGSARLITLKI
jgi:hypothetical protein